DEIDGYYEAYCTFKRLIDESPYKLEHQFSPGDVMSFNNQRILHGRSAINRNGGIRHLVGCYLNIDSFSSKLKVLSEELNKKMITKHTLNGSSYL
ncbi:PREDICTED: gamma-butyrobetaine dioxygenase-like, partial [Amphimedon queenslandica]|uniref:TauD/TfdA-like domain-containing protein n=1 Tax=Amphimedon queenslandica TaxID=400682 RepID=A0AAN0JE18_AMPQE